MMCNNFLYRNRVLICCIFLLFLLSCGYIYRDNLSTGKIEVTFLSIEPRALLSGMRFGSDDKLSAGPSRYATVMHYGSGSDYFELYGDYADLFKDNRGYLIVKEGGDFKTKLIVCNKPLLGSCIQTEGSFIDTYLEKFSKG